MRLVWLPFVVACSSASAPAAEQSAAAAATAPTATPAPSGLVAIKPITIRFDGNPIARLHADGRTEAVGDGTPGPNATLVPGPTLHADGTIELTKAGFTARVEPNGDIIVVSPPASKQPEHLYGRLVGDKLVTETDQATTFRLEGATLMGDSDSGGPYTLGIVDDPSAVRTILIMTAAFFIDLSIK